MTWAAQEENYLRYRLFFEASAEGMLVATTKGVILDANPEACRILRRTREEIISAGFDAFFDTSDPRLEPAWEEQRRTGRFKGELRLLRWDRNSFPARLLRWDRTSFPADMSIAVYRDGGEKKIGIIFRDVTERNRSEEELRRSEERFRSLVQNTSDIISVIEVDGTVSYMSPATKRVLGYRPEERVGTKAFDSVHPDDMERALSIFAEILDKPGVHSPIEFRVPHADGSWRYLEHVINNLLDDPSVRGIVVSSRDITERKRAEEALRESEEQLQNLVSKLLTAQEEERRHVAYEIHDGLAQVAGAAHQHLQAFAWRYRSTGTTEYREKLDRILELVWQTVEDARRVIADLRPTVLDDFGLAAAIRQKVETLRAEGWKITYEVPPRNERLPAAVETTLYRVAQEALTNVGKHAGTTRVHVELRRVGESVRLRVQDRGCGFQAATPSIGGGPSEKVGLSSMRERVALLGGDLEIHSQPGVGTSIIAEVPLSTRAEQDNNYASESSPARLIIADDHHLSRTGLRSMLESEADLEVIGEAANGREAAMLCRRVRPDLVLMDVRMSEMDGLAATSAIKREHPNISIIMVTMHEDPDYLYEALKAGAAGYVLKSATQSELTHAVRKVLGGECVLNTTLASELLQRLASEETERKKSPQQSPNTEETPESLLEPLTPREVEVLELLTRGQNNREIARSLVISPNTAKLHVHRVISKLGVSDRTQAAIRAIKLGLVKQD